MFNNIGRKIMGLAKVLCWVGIVLSVIMAIVCFASDSVVTYNGTWVAGGAAMGFVVLIAGVLGSWIGSWVLYALGQAVEDLHRIAEK